MSIEELNELAEKTVATVDTGMLADTVKILRSLEYRQTLGVSTGYDWAGYECYYTDLTQEQADAINADPILSVERYRDWIMTHGDTRTLSSSVNYHMRRITEDDVLYKLIDYAPNLPSLFESLGSTGEIIAEMAGLDDESRYYFRRFLKMTELKTERQDNE